MPNRTLKLDAVMWYIWWYAFSSRKLLISGTKYYSGFKWNVGDLLHPHF